MKKLYLIRPEWSEVPGFDFKIDTEFESREAAEEYCKENSVTHYYIEETIPNRKLFFIDVIARIPYGVKFRFELDKGVYKTISVTNAKDLPHLDILYSYWMGRGYLLPYLRPMSSMTEEEKKEFDEVIKSCNNKVFTCPEQERRYMFFDAEQEDFMNSHHLDYRGLIPMGLALEAPEDMYKTE